MGQEIFNAATRGGLSLENLRLIAAELNIALPDNPFAKAGTNGPTLVAEAHVLKGRGDRIDPQFFIRESAVQGLLALKGLPVPMITHQGDDFFVMERIRSDMLLRDPLESLPPERQQNIAGQIGGFIHDMATVLSHEGQAILGDTAQSPCFFSGDKIETQITTALDAKLITPEHATILRTVHEEYAQAITQGALPAIIYHADLNGSNILLDPDTGHVTVIDFGSVHQGPVSECLATLHQCYSPDFVRAVADAYAKQSGGSSDYRHIVACSAFLSLGYMLDRAADPMGDADGVKRYQDRLHVALAECAGGEATAAPSPPLPPTLKSDAAPL